MLSGFKVRAVRGFGGHLRLRLSQGPAKKAYIVGFSKP